MLTAEHLSKTFNKGTINQKTAIKDVSLELHDGDFVTVIGGNGAGKSTLLNLISGLHTRDKGKITIDGMVISKLPEYKRAKYIGRVFQDPMMGTCADMTIEENLAMAFRRGKRRGLHWGISEKERQFFKRQLEMLELGLEDRMSSKVGLLSGGQRQALTLLMATMMYEVTSTESVEKNLIYALNRGHRPLLKRHLSAKQCADLSWHGKRPLSELLMVKASELDKPDYQALQDLMSELTKPKLLLLDEHTAALDPKTAKKVLELTETLISRHHLTTIMITHNMRDALAYGNRLWMMNNGQLALDIPAEKKKTLQVNDLLGLFEDVVGESLNNDRMLLS